MNAAGTRLYSANATDRAETKRGSVSSFAINQTDGTLHVLNTVRSGGAGPTFVSVHPAGRHLLVANYFGGSVAVFPIWLTAAWATSYVLKVVPARLDRNGQRTRRREASR